MVVLEKSGLEIRNIYVLHVNNQYVRSGEVDPTEIVTKTEITEKVRSKIDYTLDNIEKALEIFLGCEAKCNHSYIIEGYHVTPSLVSKLKDSFEIQSVFLGREDKEDIIESITIDKNPNNWVVGKTKDPKTFEKISDMILVFSEQIKREVESNEQKYLAMDGDFESNLNKATGYFGEREDK